MNKLWAPCLLLLLSACGLRPDAPDMPDAPGMPPVDPTTPSDILVSLGLWASGLGAILMLLAIVLAVFFPVMRVRCLQWAIGAVGLIAGGQILFWLGGHMWVLVLASVFAALAVAYKARKQLELWFGVDLDRDGHIGPAA